MNNRRILRRKILRQTLREYWPLFAVALALLVICAALIPRFREAPPKYSLETAGSEVDFTAPDIQVHTAAEGIAVVNTQSPIKPPRSDPAEIWQTDSTPTHGGFTLPVAMEDDSIGILTIPDIGLSVPVYESDNEMEDMEKGAAHFKSTSAFEGNIGISAHNVNFDGTAGYFYDLHTLQKGATIQYETALGKREYVVESVTEISETDWEPLGRTQDNRITLITCISGKPAQRLCVQGVEKE